MKKQNNIKRYRLLLSLIVLFGALFSVATTKTALANGTCYTNTGNMRVAPTTSTCTVDPNGRKVYLDLNGNTITPDNSEFCYAGTSAGSGSFVTITYQQADCASLEILRANAVAEQNQAPDTEEECLTRGGSWVPVGTTADGTEYGHHCEGWRQSDQQAPADSQVEIRESARSDCNTDDLNGDNCGIIAILNTVFNFVSGGVAIAVIGNIIFAGIQYSTAQGDPSTAAKSKKRISDALLAFLMYLMLFAFIQWLIPGGVF